MKFKSSQEVDDYSKQKDVVTYCLSMDDYLIRFDILDNEISEIYKRQKEVNRKGFAEGIDNRQDYNPNKDKEYMELEKSANQRIMSRGGYFIRKSYYSFGKGNKDVQPIFFDERGRIISRLASGEKVADAIDEGSLGLKGFEFNEGLSIEEKQKAFDEIVGTFISTSQNLDFQSERNQFHIEDVRRGICVGYNNARGLEKHERNKAICDEFRKQAKAYKSSEKSIND